MQLVQEFFLLNGRPKLTILEILQYIQAGRWEGGGRKARGAVKWTRHHLTSKKKYVLCFSTL